MLYLQNKVTGEIKDVEESSPEYKELIAERTEGGKPVYEQTSDAAIIAKINRAKSGELRDSDLPKNTPVSPERNVVDGFAAQKEPWRELTAGEKKLGLTAESKAAQEQNRVDTVVHERNARSHEQAADAILSSDSSLLGRGDTSKETPEEGAERERLEAEQAASEQGGS